LKVLLKMVAFMLFGIFFSARDFKKSATEKPRDRIPIARKVDSHAEDAVSKWNVPTNLCHLQVFGIANIDENRHNELKLLSVSHIIQLKTLTS